jgi:hypothetical protein
MGLSPDQVLAMTLHDYQAALFYFARSQGGEIDEDTLGDDEFDEMMVGMAAFERSQVVH